MRSASAATSMRRWPSTGIHRTAAVPRPLRSAAFWIHVWVSAEQYATSLDAPGAFSPCCRASHGALAVRAAQNPTMLAMLPPLTSRPPLACGAPTSSPIHATVCSSMSVAIGDRPHEPQLGFTVAASSSASEPSGAADEVM